MRSIAGIGASGGVAVGPLHLHRPVELDPASREVGELEQELADLEAAIAEVDTRLAALEDSTLGSAGSDAAEIFGVHRMFLADPSFIDPIRDRVRSGLGAAVAIAEGAEQLAAEFEAIGDDYFSQRAADIRDIGVQLLRSVMGVTDSPLSSLTEPVVIAAHDLTPSDTASIPPGMVAGFITSVGSATSHTAILSRAMGVPAVVGVGEEAGLVPGSTVIVDGDSGIVTVDPDRESVKRALARAKEFRRLREVASRSSHEPAVTLDGHGVEIVANVGSAADAVRAVEAGAEGIGLLRTEFLFLDRATLPDEATQEADYREIFGHFPELPIVVRTLDVGGDKELPSIVIDEELNPFLGKRGIRLTFTEAHLFDTQVRAVLRAAAGRSVHIMFPMIGSVDEVLRAKAEIDRLIEELDAEGVERAPEIEIGIMVEVPSAAVMADVLAGHVDFFSIGTNDLTQYTLAVDRTNPAVAHMADALHPAVLRMIRGVVEAAHDHGKWVGVCGELAGDVAATEILVGLGVDELSMSPPSIPLVKQRVREISRSMAREFARSCLDMAGPLEVREALAGR